MVEAVEEYDPLRGDARYQDLVLRMIFRSRTACNIPAPKKTRPQFLRSNTGGNMAEQHQSDG